MIEQATIADGERIQEITAAVDVFTPADAECVQELWQDMLRRGREASGYEFLVAREHELAVGYICFGPTPLTQGTYDIYWLAVDPSQRRRGLGRALLARAESEIERAGGRLILIETSGALTYQATRRFYESCGYRYAAIIHDFYATGEDLIVYRKNL